MKIFLLLLSMVGFETAKMLPMQLPVFDKEGHRGCRGLMPENTIPAMLKALDVGVTTLEMDAVITKDGKVILSHEPFFNHEITTLPDGSYYEAGKEKAYNIFRMDYAETQTYDVGLKINPKFPNQQKLRATKPLLSAVIDAVEQRTRQQSVTGPFYNIETKTKPSTDNVFHPAPEEFVDILMKVISGKGIADRVVIQSFDFRTLQVLHKKYPAIKTSMLIEGTKLSVEEAFKSLGFIPSICSPEYHLVNEALVRACHQRQVKVIPWTVNDEASMNNLKAMGVDGLISDFPDLFDKKP